MTFNRFLPYSISMVTQKIRNAALETKHICMDSTEFHHILITGLAQV